MMVDPIPETLQAIKLVNESQVTELPLDENDPIFATSFRAMILEAFGEGKHFFVAVV